MLALLELIQYVLSACYVPGTLVGGMLDTVTIFRQLSMYLERKTNIQTHKLYVAKFIKTDMKKK